MMEVYEKYVEDNDGVDIQFPGYFLGKNAKVKAKHARDRATREAKKLRSRNR